MIGEADVSQRSLVAVVSDILKNVQAILRAELRLAKAEVQHESGQAVRAGAWLAAGAVAGLSAWLFLLATAVLGLATRLPYWQATSIVAAGLVLLSVTLVVVGRGRIRQLKTPERTAEALRKNLQWIRHLTR